MSTAIALEAQGEVMPEYKKENCPKCGLGMVYLRLKKNEFICRNCGNVWPKAPKEKKK